MKYFITLFSILAITIPAFSITNQEITTRVISDKAFVLEVETAIKNRFRQPKMVKLRFASVQAAMGKSPYFYAKFRFDVQAGDIGYGLCSHTVLGVIQPNASLLFQKIVHEDCGE